MMYFEDIQPGEVVVGPTFTIDRDEMVEFAKRWDPQPFHIDDEAGNAAFGGITAPGVFLLAVKIRLLHQFAGAVGGDRRTRVRRLALSRSGETR